MNGIGGSIRTAFGEYASSKARIVGLGVIVAGVLVTAVVLAAAGNFGAGSNSGRTTDGAPAPVGAPPPAGMQAISYHGVQIYVPAAWPINDTRCGTPQADTVLLADGDATPTCLVSGPRGLTVVSMTRLNTSGGRQDATVARTATHVVGGAARIGTGTLPHLSDRVTSLVIPSIDVVVAVSSPSAADAMAVLRTAHVVAIDSNGCVQHVSDLVPQALGDVAAEQARLVPGTPVSTTLCRYSRGWLVQSVALSAGQGSALRALLNRLPAGATHDPSLVGGRSCVDGAAHGFLAHFRLSDDSDLQVAVHIGDCPTLTAYNGRRRTAISEPLVDELARLGGYDGALPEPHNLLPN